MRYAIASNFLVQTFPDFLVLYLEHRKNKPALLFPDQPVRSLTRKLIASNLPTNKLRNISI